MRAFSALLAVLAAFSIAACSDDSTTAPEVESNQVKATVDGQAWTSTTVTAMKQNGQTAIVAQGPNSSAINLSLGTISTPGDYTIGTQAVAAYSVGTSGYVGMSGSLKVTAFDASHVTGTFSFEAVNPANGQSISVTGGSFNAKF